MDLELGYGSLKGETMKHGATDEGDIVGIFIIDGAFDIHYKDEE